MKNPPDLTKWGGGVVWKTISIEVQIFTGVECEVEKSDGIWFLSPFQNLGRGG